MKQEILHTAQIAIAAFAAGMNILLAFLFGSSSISNRDSFTTKFLKVLALISALRAYEVISAGYRTARIAADCLPLDATIVGLQGRAVELIGYTVMVWFLMRPETKRALNGGGL